MTGEELSRVNRQPVRNTNESKGNGLTVFLIMVILLNAVAIGLLIYLTIDSRAAYDEQEKKIVAIEKHLSDLSQPSDKSGFTASPAVEGSKGTNTQAGNTATSTTGSESGQGADISGTGTNNSTQSNQNRNVHVVTSGDTLSVISDTENVSVEELRRLNNLEDDVLQVGQELILE